MASRLNAKAKFDIIEHYAYRRSSNCIKFDTINQMIGGLYDHHPCVTYKTAVHIFDKFLSYSKKLQENKVPDLTVETLQVEETYENEKIKYRIHTYNRERCTTRRKALWLFAGILIKLPELLGYTRIFCFPCKCNWLNFSCK